MKCCFFFFSALGICCGGHEGTLAVSGSYCFDAVTSPDANEIAQDNDMKPILH